MKIDNEQLVTANEQLKTDAIQLTNENKSLRKIIKGFTSGDNGNQESSDDQDNEDQAIEIEDDELFGSNNYREMYLMKKGLTIAVYNSLPLKSQQYIISELLLHSPAAKTNEFLPKINNLLVFLMQFIHNEKNKFMQIITNDVKSPLLELTENCEIHLLSRMTEVLFQNQSLGSQDFINNLKEFNDFSIEIKYPYKYFKEIYRVGHTK